MVNIVLSMVLLLVMTAGLEPSQNDQEVQVHMEDNGEHSDNGQYGTFGHSGSESDHEPSVQEVEIEEVDVALAQDGLSGSCAADIIFGDDPYARDQFAQVMKQEDADVPIRAVRGGAAEKMAQAARVAARLATELGQSNKELENNLSKVNEELQQNQITAKEAELRKFYSYAVAAGSAAFGIASVVWEICRQVGNDSAPAVCSVICDCTAGNATLGFM